MENNDRKWEVLHSEYLIQRPWLTARRDCVRLPNGVENDEYYVLEYPDWVNVIAITAEGKFLMERQYRHGLQWTGYEICAGVCENLWNQQKGSYMKKRGTQEVNGSIL